MEKAPGGSRTEDVRTKLSQVVSLGEQNLTEWSCGSRVSRLYGLCTTVHQTLSSQLGEFELRFVGIRCASFTAMSHQ